MRTAKNAIDFLKEEMSKREQDKTLSFNEYIERVARNPERMLRNIFQLFYDMVKSYVGEGEDEYPGDPESIGFVKYDCSKLFVEGADNPFLADRLFANRFIRQVEGLKHGFQQNRIYIYEGPSGCGKSTFLNNLLRTFEYYTSTEEGQSFELVWEIDESRLKNNQGSSRRRTLFIPCPSHDYPILIIPKDIRLGFLRKLLSNTSKELRQRIFNEKEYEWLFREEVCTICKSIFSTLLEKLGSLDEVLEMIKARRYKFNRRTGEGISIFNPGDKPAIEREYFTDQYLQRRLDDIFGVGTVRYIYSRLAKTNNGIYVLMDIKGYNKDRLLELHNVISEGVHKVGEVIEERITSLFFALMNPEDKKLIEEKEMESFQGRVYWNKIPFVLEPVTELNIYRNIFGGHFDEIALPRVLENFAKVIVASRMYEKCEPLEQWISDISQYERYCDPYGLLLRMSIYSGIIPEWLSEKDRRNFTADVRRALVAHGAKEGDKGFSGRESLALFSDFLTRYSGCQSLISMADVLDFFKHKIDKQKRDVNIPKNFLASLEASYDYTVLNEVKDSLYFYSEEDIKQDILMYLSAVSYDPGQRIRCKYTGKIFEVTIEFLKRMATYITGIPDLDDQKALELAKEIRNKYVALIYQGVEDITETELYQELLANYSRGLRERVLDVFVDNESFREAINSFGTDRFFTFDTRLREHIKHMIRNLMTKYGYTEQGAKQISLYVLDKKLVEKFSK